MGFFLRQVIILSLMVTIVPASLVSFESSPDQLKTNLSDALSMRCFVTNDQKDDVKRVASIFITKNDGVDVASVTTFTAPQALADLGNLAAKGSLSATSGEGELQLAWTAPGQVELGDYQCKVTAVDSKGHSVLLTSGLTLTSEPPSMDDVIKFFNRKLLDQQQIITQQQETIRTQHADLSNLTNKVQILANENSQQTTEINKLKTCTSTSVAFHAAISHSRFGSDDLLPIGDGSVVMWDLVSLNEGSSYHSSSGEFRCSVPGVYVFHAHVMSSADYYADLRLEKNGKEVVDFAKDSNDEKSEATVTQTMSLSAGDVVRVAGNWAWNHLYQKDDILLGANFFTGHIIHPTAC